MANRLILRDKKGYPWGNVEARVIWTGGGQDRVWVNSNGVGEFGGTGNVSHIKVAGEELSPNQSKVNGSTTIAATSTRSH